MSDWNAKIIDQTFSYNLWANIQLIELCRQLDEEQLSFEIDGAYGGIRAFLTHIVRAEGNYVRRLAGTSLWDDDADWEGLAIDTILERARQSGQRLVEIASKTNPESRHEVEHDGKPYYFFNWTVLAQAATHGMEHRTHVKVLLTHLGIEHPDLSVWDYMESLQ